MTTSLSAEQRVGRKPRVRSVPYATSAGREAIDLAASAGLILDDWQQDVLVDALGERPDGTWAAREVGLIVPRQNGKGAVIEAMELAGLFLFDEKLILHSAHEFKTATEAFRRIVFWIESSDDLRKRVKRITTANGDEGIETRAGNRLRFVARSKGSGRGFSGDRVILDEAYALTAEQMAALMPTLSARPNPQIIYTSTPPLEPAALLVSLRRRGTEGSPRLAYFEWSPPEGYDPDDRQVWYETNPALGIRITEETIESEQGMLPSAEFRRERLGEWPPSAGGHWQVIDEADWRARHDPNSEMTGTLALAVDVTPSRSHAAISAGGRRPDGDRHVEVIDHRAGTGWVVRRIKELRERHPVSAVAVDTAGPAASLIVELEEAGIEVFKIGAQQAAAACGAFYDGTVAAGEEQPAGDDVPRDRSPIWHLDQDSLTTALRGAVKRTLGASWAWDRVGTDVDLTPLVSCTNAAYAFAATAGNQVVIEGSLMA